MAARAKPEALERKGESDLLIALGPHLEDFLAALFGIAGDIRTLEGKHHELAPLYAVKRLFVQRKAMNAHRADAAATLASLPGGVAQKFAKNNIKSREKLATSMMPSGLSQALTQDDLVDLVEYLATLKKK